MSLEISAKQEKCMENQSKARSKHLIDYGFESHFDALRNMAKAHPSKMGRLCERFNLFSGITIIIGTIINYNNDSNNKLATDSINNNNNNNNNHNNNTE
jgi:hypothetical protein